MECRKIVPIRQFIHNEYAEVERPTDRGSDGRPRSGLADPITRTEDRKNLQYTRPV